MRWLATAGMALALVGMGGCFKPEPVLYRVYRGMSEKQLVEALGAPLSVQVDGIEKTFYYESWTNNLRGIPAHLHRWHVHLSRGRVDGYGGDDTKA